MLFPDYYFFAKRRLENYTIETRKVENLDDCELMCYLNDNCVSLNFKKGPDNNDSVHICELNNATHLKYDSDLTADENFYYRGSKVSYKSIFSKLLSLSNMKPIINVYANFRVFDYSISSFLFHSIPPPFFRYFIFLFFSLRTLVIRIPGAKITQLASLDLHSRDIDACVLLDSRENIVKRVKV